jgi:hypothetical protein
MSWQACTIASFFTCSIKSRSKFASTAACLTCASALTSNGYEEISVPVIEKFSTARSVWIPQ